MSLGTIFGALSGASALAGLFGRRSNAGAQGLLNQGQDYYNQAAGYLAGEGGVGSEYGSLANQALGNYNAYEPQYQNAVNALGNYYKTDPYTDQYSTQSLAGATNGTTQAYQGAKAALTSDLASRGMMGDSSLLAGGLAGIDQGAAATEAGAQNQLAYNKIAANQGRLAALTNLYGGAAQGAYGQGVGALGGEMGADQAAAGGYQGMGSAYLGLGQNLQAENAQYNQGLNSMVGSALGGLGSYYGLQAVLNGKSPYGNLGGLLGAPSGGLPMTPPIAPSGGLPMTPDGLTPNYGLGFGF